LKSKVELSERKEIEEMAKNNEFYWYECTGRDRFRSWFQGTQSNPYCPKGHKMKIDKKAAWYTIANDIINYLDSNVPN
jgi:hypothetical protein